MNDDCRVCRFEHGLNVEHSCAEHLKAQISKAIDQRDGAVEKLETVTRTSMDMERRLREQCDVLARRMEEANEKIRRMEVEDDLFYRSMDSVHGEANVERELREARAEIESLSKSYKLHSESATEWHTKYKQAEAALAKAREELKAKSEECERLKESLIIECDDCVSHTKHTYPGCLKTCHIGKALAPQPKEDRL